MGGNFRAVVLNAGLGDLTLGLTQAGFQVEAAYEEDAPTAAVHKANFKVPVHPSPPRGKEVWDVPQPDLLAARLKLPGSERRREADPSLTSFLEVLNNCRPRGFLVLLNAAAIRKDHHRQLLAQIAQAGYWSAYQMLDTAKMTGFPVQERKLILIGGQEGKEQRFWFPESRIPVSERPERFLELTQQVDPWYFRIRHGEDVPMQDGMRFYCWNGHGYAGTNSVKWDPWRVPLVWDGSALRKITHREIARLKGFPDEYSFPLKDKNRLYQKLVYAGNVIVICQVAEAIRRALEEHLWHRPQIGRAQLFEELLERYLADRAEAALVEWDKSGMQPDFMMEYNGKPLFIEAKSYSSAAAPELRLIEACKRLHHDDKTGTLVLAVANKVSASLKSRLSEEYGIYVWDVANLLWLFDGQEGLKNEFIALLDYTVEGIKPEPPYPNPFHEEPPESPEPEEKEPEPGWKERLDRIAADKTQAADYETFCVEFLKSVLSPYLALWKTQERSNDGLYRFDLCCKIKMGADRNAEFFDTIQRYFNTKYIVFEFKNHSKPITQKEIYTTEKYLYEKALRKVAIIISRKGVDKHGEQAARGCLRETGKLILCLSDGDLLRMNALEERGEGDPADVLGEKLDALLIDLEK